MVMKIRAKPDILYMGKCKAVAFPALLWQTMHLWAQPLLTGETPQPRGYSIRLHTIVHCILLYAHPFDFVTGLA